MAFNFKKDAAKPLGGDNNEGARVVPHTDEPTAKLPVAGEVAEGPQLTYNPHDIMETATLPGAKPQGQTWADIVKPSTGRKLG